MYEHPLIRPIGEVRLKDNESADRRKRQERLNRLKRK
jgi:hypothetical protein